MEEREIILTGKIIDAETKEGLSFASVQVHQATDSSLVGGGLTNKVGEFSIKTETGEYYLAVTYLGYESLIVGDIQVAKGLRRLDLGKILMTKAAVEIDEVEITAEKSQVEFKLDKRVYNVSKDVTAVGSTADELLQNLPSVEVDGEGNVSLRGSQNVRLLVDGKPSGLISGGPEALRLLQGDLIEKIEVITNPSAKYDAEGEVGIINIVLRKDRKKGLNGSFSISGGYPENFSASANINLRRNKFNFFTNVGASYRNSPGLAFFTQNNVEEDTAYSSITDRTFFRAGWTPNIRFGSEYFFNDKNTLSLAGNARFRSGNNTTRLTYSDFDENEVLTSVTERLTTETEQQNTIGLEANYTKTFDQKGRKWTIDLNLDRTDDQENSEVNQVLLEGGGDDPAEQRIRNQEDRQTIFFQSDYVHPFGRKMKFETGTRASYRTFDNDYKVESFVDGEWVPDERFFNRFIYLEGIYAAYAIVNQERKKFSYQLGLRLEHTDIVTESRIDSIRNPRNYTNLFPSASFSYKLKPSTTMQFSYSRRISRPSSRSLQPFNNFADARNTYEGNPDLDPEFTQSFEAGILNYQKKGSILASIYYRYRTNVIERVTLFEGDRFRLFPINLSTQNAYGVEASISRDLAKWWKISANANFSRAITEGVYQDSLFFADATNLNGRVNSRWIFKDAGNFQATFNYRGPRVNPQGRSRAVYSLDLGYTIEVLSGKGTLNFSVRDVFNSRKYRRDIIGPEFTRTLLYQRRLRQFTVSFNYLLNQDKKRGRDGRGGRPSGGRREDFGM